MSKVKRISDFGLGTGEARRRRISSRERASSSLEISGAALGAADVEERAAGVEDGAANVQDAPPDVRGGSDSAVEGAAHVDLERPQYLSPTTNKNIHFLPR